MGDGESDDWSHDEDPFTGSKPKVNPAEVEPSVESSTGEDSDAAEENQSPETSRAEGLETAVLKESTWGLPLRVAPVLKQFHGEEVSEYPLQQSLDGTKTTSLVVDGDLLRIVEAHLDDSGQRRLKVSLSMNREITGFKHRQNELMHQYEWLWIASSIAGLLLLFISSSFWLNILGFTSLSLGLVSWIVMHLEIHQIEFSNSGGVHSKTLFGLRTNRPFFRTSMALLGSEMAGLQRNGLLETATIEQLHSALALPPPVSESTQDTPSIQTPPVLQPPALPQNIPAPPQNIPAPPQNIPAPPTQIPPVEPHVGPPVSAPQPLPAPLPLPAVLPMPQPTPLPAPAPLTAPPSPALLPPPAPLPPLSGAMPPPPPIAGLRAPAPLDAPLPNAPEIPVIASPVEDTLSKAEQNQLLSELS